MDNTQLHEFRKKIDAVIVVAQKEVEPGAQPPYRREMEIALVKLQEAKMWVGKCLEAIGSELPKEFQDKAK